VKSLERELSAEKKEAILSGAMQEFLEHGYAGARIDKIVMAAGVSKATVYRHFADKEALFTALIQRLAGKTNLYQQQDLLAFQEEPTVFLKRFATGVIGNMAKNSQDLALFRIIIGESERFPALAQAFIRTVEKPNLDFLTYYFATHPQLQIDDPEVAARTLIGTLIHSVITRELLHGKDIVPIECDRLVDSLLNLIIHKDKYHE
jgi:TetR/AcrR family transcriptional regulator, regulator of autoinduction and epiphytic fitness